MNTNEIIKTLECCINDNCNSCPETFGDCELTAMRNALDLIKRQQTEIARLKYNLKAVLDERADHSEAVTEFAEKLKGQFDHLMYVTGDEVKNRVDNLLKEKAGVTE